MGDITKEVDEFERNVFINCPFDSEYKQMLRVLIFAVIECGLEPRIALEREDSGEERINKIKELIRSSKYSIHDISRMDPLKKGDLPRFNLPFELGLDLGCRTYGQDRLLTKKCLILDKEEHRYLKVISDISGNDIRAHNSKNIILIRQVRRWIRSIFRREILGPTKILKNFLEFSVDYDIICKTKGFNDDDIEDMPITEYIDYIKEWPYWKISG